jgi:hypothetical protein
MSNYITAPSYWLLRDGVAMAPNLLQVQVRLGNDKHRAEREITFHFEAKQAHKWISCESVLLRPNSGLGALGSVGANGQGRTWHQGR